MASIVDAQNALIARLKAMPGAPSIVEPNDAEGADLPRIVVQVVAPRQSPFDATGNTLADAEINARIEVEDGNFTGASDILVAAIQSQFRPGTQFDGVTIITAPQPSISYQIDGVYHVPVTIRGRCYF